MRLVLSAVFATAPSCRLARQAPSPARREWVDWKTAQFLDAFAAREHRDDLVGIKDTTSRLTGTDDNSIGNMATMASGRASRSSASPAISFRTPCPRSRTPSASAARPRKLPSCSPACCAVKAPTNRSVKAIEDLGAS